MSVNDNDSLVNTKRGALSVIAICLIALVALTIYEYWPALTQPAEPRFVFGTPNPENSFGIERAIGFFIGSFGMTCVLPLLWWAFRRFQWSKASGPLLLRVVLVFCLGTVHLSIE